MRLLRAGQRGAPPLNCGVRRLIKRIALIAALVPILALVYVFWLDSKYRDAYRQGAIGSTTEAVVRELAGTPSYVTDGAAGHVVPGCVKELWYGMPWPLPLQFSFCFDRNGVLLHKYNWVSP
jgi:hypothetical protein